MVEITVVYQGSLHTEATHGPSSRQLETDAPKDNEGRGESFSPTDLVATALGSCMLTVMGIVALRRNWPLEGASVRVEKHMVADPVRRIGKLVAEFKMPAALDNQARHALERAAHTCPVHQSLHPDVVKDIRFVYE
ncbi:MAG: OsmC family protein [Planctomycetota bacterium]